MLLLRQVSAAQALNGTVCIAHFAGGRGVVTVQDLGGVFIMRS